MIVDDAFVEFEAVGRQTTWRRARIPDGQIPPRSMPHGWQKSQWEEYIVMIEWKYTEAYRPNNNNPCSSTLRPAPEQILIVHQGGAVLKMLL